MPALVRLYIRHTLIGFAAALAFVALLFWFDVAGLWRLVTGTEGGWLAALMLVTFNGIVFSGAQFGIAVMGMAERDRDAGPRRPAPVFDAVPVPVRERHPRRRG